MVHHLYINEYLQTNVDYKRFVVCGSLHQWGELIVILLMISGKLHHGHTYMQ